MTSHKLKRARFITTLLIAIFLLTGTILAVFFAKGYRPNPKKGITSFEGTGLLSVTSEPKPANVYIDNELVSATDDTINLEPGKYTIKIDKDGFHPWQKEVIIENELVSSANARLFPIVPSLKAVTFTGVKDPVPSPDGKKLAFIVDTLEDKEKNGIFLIDLTNSLINLNRTPSTLLSQSNLQNLDNIILTWTPDSKNILLSFTNEKKDTIVNSYLLPTDRQSNLNTLPDVTVRLPLIFEEWEKDITLADSSFLKNTPEFIQNLATSSANNIYFSPDGEKMLYQATTSVSIPETLIPKVKAINPTPQTRNLKSNHLYVYDSKEDTNYLISSTTTEPKKPFVLKTTLFEELTQSATETATSSGITPASIYQKLQENRNLVETLYEFRSQYSPVFTSSTQWYPTSNHLITTQEGKIIVKEYDNQNQTTIYSGPFDDSFIYPSPNGDRLFILTNLNQDDNPYNIYALELK